MNYVNSTKTIKCAQSLLNQKNVSCRIVIVENCSPNDSTERLRRTSKGYQVPLRDGTAFVDAGQSRTGGPWAQQNLTNTAIRALGERVDYGKYIFESQG